jgi:uncharacterized membrane protein
MKKAVIIASLILFVYIVLSESGVLNALLVFLLVGAVPGTTITISPNFMLLGIGIIAWLVLFNLMAVRIANFATSKRLIGKYITRTERMPKRRYSRI